MNHDKPLPLASFLHLEQYRSRSKRRLVVWRQLSWKTLMIYFHPNALDTHRLGAPAKRILHAAIALGIEQGEGPPPTAYRLKSFCGKLGCRQQHGPRCESC